MEGKINNVAEWGRPGTTARHFGVFLGREKALWAPVEEKGVLAWMKVETAPPGRMWRRQLAR